MAALADLAWIMWMAACGAVFTLPATIWRPRRFVLRYMQYLAQINCVWLTIGAWFYVAAPEWWKSLAFDLGVLAVVAWTVFRRRRRSRSPVSTGMTAQLPVARSTWLLDYMIGLALYLLFVFVCAQASSLRPAGSGAIGLVAVFAGNFLANQLYTGAALRLLNSAIALDYRMDRKMHYLLAAVAILSGLVLALAVGGSIASFLTSMVILALGWQLTNCRPNETIAIGKEVVRRLRSGQRHASGPMEAKEIVQPHDIQSRVPAHYSDVRQFEVTSAMSPAHPPPP